MTDAPRLTEGEVASVGPDLRDLLWLHLDRILTDPDGRDADVEADDLFDAILATRTDPTAAFIDRLPTEVLSDALLERFRTFSEGEDEK